MKREGGVSATKAMQEKLAQDAMKLDGMSEPTSPDILAEEPSAQDAVAYQDSFADVWKLGKRALWDPFLGRISRGEYLVGRAILSIIFSLLSLGFGAIYVFIGQSYATTIGGDVAMILAKPLVYLIFGVTILLCLSLAVKRFHDFDQSGWLVLLFIVPLYNIYLAVKLICFDGDQGLNDQGDDPLKQQPKSNIRYGIIVGVGLVFSLASNMYAGSLRDITKTPVPPELAEEQATCLKSRGEMQQVGKGQTRHCMHTYRDGGIPCDSSTECRGDCLIDFDLRSVTDSCARKGDCELPEEGIQGACAHTDNPFGCKGTVEEKKVTCVD